MPKVYIGLVHYPIYNKKYEIVATAVTNLDIHDIARTAVTYGVDKYWIIHPQKRQQELVAQITGYWQEGFGGQSNPDRRQALDVVGIADSVEDVCARIEERHGERPVIVTTDAREYPNTVSYAAMRQIIARQSAPLLLLFGTGNGMTREAMESFDYILEPIRSKHGYNHLCVRAAAAIIIDRLLGE